MGMYEIFVDMSTSTIVRLISILIVGDVVFGVLRACKEKTINSTIGIDGIIRKVAILLSVIILYFTDVLLNINVISLLPNDVINALHLPEIGLAEFFGMVLSSFELISIISNYEAIGLPMPRKLKNLIQKFLNDMTQE